MENTKTLTIGFGALAPSIAKQLKLQGLKYNTEEVKYYEKLRDCIQHLSFSNLINESVRDKIKQKLFNKIRRHVIDNNKLKIV